MQFKGPSEKSPDLQSIMLGLISSKPSQKWASITKSTIFPTRRQQQQQQILCQQRFVRHVAQSSKEPGHAGGAPAQLRHAGGELAVEHDPAHVRSGHDDVPDPYQVLIKAPLLTKLLTMNKCFWHHAGDRWLEEKQHSFIHFKCWTLCDFVYSFIHHCFSARLCLVFFSKLFCIFNLKSEGQMIGSLTLLTSC